MDFLTIGLSFFTVYETILLPLFMLGIINMIVHTFSLSFGLLSVLMFGLFLFSGTIVYAHIAVVSIVVAVVLKYVGL